MPTSVKVAHDKEMASRLKQEGVERRSQRCAICYHLIPNGTFEPARVDAHTLSCPGPDHKG